MRISLFILCSVLLSAFTVLSAEPNSTELAQVFEKRLEVLRTETQHQIELIEAQLSECSAKEVEAFEKQIIAIKQDATISRLEILLEWAAANNDTERETEIRNHLDQLRTLSRKEKDRTSIVVEKSPEPSQKASNGPQTPSSR
ncbi:hypothetical protein KKC97_13395 [bacterium]|nr:hypothetical protein [bacterium]MBU1638652.1 hypothetical protein [bacterium]